MSDTDYAWVVQFYDIDKSKCRANIRCARKEYKCVLLVVVGFVDEMFPGL